MLLIKIKDCLRCNFTSARYDTREIILKAGIDVTPYINMISRHVVVLSISMWEEEVLVIKELSVNMWWEVKFS